ncbi:HNH endonuclease [Hahella sp. KA22]|uniref:HNH endonuclease n=1 Tax=Hahella sp. KA22 TaxID=1628392 RepID=UPI000FDD6D98|nr:HNH endonuclease [Hahella sp. KA22]AZZ90692.1 HNH endonuclease [Hahella sp. KA22]QAY54062.1 HNH endonuclease [Hahella sp. KA22]
MSTPRILRLDKTGQPMQWMSQEEAATLICNDRVLWSAGDNVIVLRGGTGRDGQRSTLEIPTIIASEGRDKHLMETPPLTNKYLFRRDDSTCMYCGLTFPYELLSRDHIMPVSRGGRDIWKNVVCACIRCNNFKRDRTPEEAGMPLLAVPFVPSRYEYLYLTNRNILGDQMEFLRKGFSRHLLARIA